MNKYLLLLPIVFLYSFTYAQKTKKITIKSDYPSYKEIYHVLKSDESIRHGSYQKEVRGKLINKGEFQNNSRVGVWEYFDANGEVVHKVEVSTGKLVFDKFPEKNSKIDKEKHSRPLIVLGGFSRILVEIAQNLRYPSEAVKKGTEGKVMVKINVSPEGTINGVDVIEGVGDGLDEEAVRVIKLLDFEFLPLLDLGGTPIESNIILPINFSLN